MEYVDKQTGVVLDREPSIVCENCGTIIDVSGIRPFAEAVCPACHHGNPIPARLGHFLLYRLIGTGGMGGIYYGKDETLGRFVAVKVMLQSVGADDAVVQSFKREAQSAAQLNHPNIVQIYSFGQEKGQPYIVMELVKGRKFAGMIEETTEGLDAGLVMRIALNIAEGLQAAGDADLVHGDVKPENILLDERMQAKLVDFGLASISRQQAGDGVWGTPYYIAPEKALRQPADIRSDIYSLGATIFHALTGRPPFEGETPTDVVKARLGNKAPAVSELKTDVNPDIDRVVARMLEEDPSRRYPTYASLIGDLRRVVKDISATESGQPITSVKSKKLVIKKKSPRILVEPRTPELDPETENVLDSFKKNPLESRPSRSKVALVVFVVFLIMAIAAAAVFVTLAAKKKRAAEVQARAISLALRKQTDEADRLKGQTAKSGAGIAELEAATAGLPERATNSVFVILGETIPAVPPPPPAPPQAPTNATAIAPADTNAPPLVSTNAAGQAPQPESATNAPPPAEQPPQPEPVDDRPAIVLGKRVVNGANAVRLRAASAREAAARASALHGEIALATVPDAAVSNVTALAEIADSLVRMKNEATDSLRDAEAALRDLETLEKKTVARRLDDARRQEKEQEEKRAEELRQQAMEAELKRIGELEPQALDEIKKFRCKEALALLSAELPGFKSAEGKAALELAVERYRYLAGLKRFLIENINSQPFRWGWGIGPTAKDITAADENGITITGGKVQWETMSFGHLLHLARHYLVLPNTKSSVVGEQNLALGIYCWLTGQQEEAARFRDRATEAAKYLESDARRLVPVL